MTTGAKRAVIFLFLFALALAGVNLLWTSHEVGRLSDAVTASCKFYGDIGSAPIIVPGGGKPSVLGVTIVSDARIAWHHLGCPGPLPAAQPSFIRWAKYYKVPYQ